MKENIPKDPRRVQTAQSPLAKFENVGLRYPTGPETLKDITFQIGQRSFQFLTGPSGAGKTSLLRLLRLTLRPTSGVITLFGRDTSSLDGDKLTALRKELGLVFQDFRLLDHLTAYENVTLPLRMGGIDEARYRSETIDILEWAGLGDRLHVFPRVLSGGEKQRVAIARAVITKANLILADEPTANLDPNLAQRLLRLFIELNNAGTAVVIATHDLALMDTHNARRLVLHQGRLHIYE